MPRKSSVLKPAADPSSGGQPVAVTELPEWVDRLIRQIKPDDPIRAKFFERGVGALFDFAKLGDQYLSDAVSAPTGYLVLLNVLKTPDVLEALQAADPLAPALVQGIEAKKRLLDEHGGVLTSEQVAKRIGLTHQAVEKRRSKGKLIAVSKGRRGYLYPAWQFTGGSVLPGLERVLDALSAHDEWTRIIFFVNGNVRLSGRTPLEALKGGDFDSVIAAAEAYGEHGAA